MLTDERLRELRRSHHIERMPYGVDPHRYLQRGQRLLETAQRELQMNPEVAMSCSYEAMLSSGLAVLAVHGLRLTGQPGHHAVLADIVNEAVEGTDYETSGRAYVRLRRMRNQSLYEAEIVDEDTAQHALAHGRRLLEWATAEVASHDQNRG